MQGGNVALKPLSFLLRTEHQNQLLGSFRFCEKVSHLCPFSDSHQSVGFLVETYESKPNANAGWGERAERETSSDIKLELILLVTL